MFTVTWSAAPAPGRAVTTGQRWAVAVGVGLVLIGVSNGWETVAGVGAILVMGGLITLAWSLVATVKRSLLRRFDLSARFYVLALAAGTVGVGLGGLMASGIGSSWYPQLRMVHFHLNLIGFVGFTIVGTLPTLLPTIAHHKAVSGSEARWGWWLAVASAVTLVSGVVGGAPVVGLGTVLAGVSLAVVLVGIVGRLGRRGLVGRLPYVQVVTGGLWLVAWTLVDGGKLLMGVAPEPFQGWTMAVVVAGIGQVFAGSLNYLVPVLVGPGSRLGRNFDRTHRRAWLPLLAANGAGVSLALGLGGPGAVFGGLWLFDLAFRLVGLERGSVDGPLQPGGLSSVSGAVRLAGPASAPDKDSGLAGSPDG
jgi:nitrite reductase (NO-forming)